MAVVKADAYGHGLLEVANHLQDAGALAVARVPEALSLRDHGIQTEIILLVGVLNLDEMAAAIAHR